MKRSILIVCAVSVLTFNSAASYAVPKNDAPPPQALPGAKTNSHEDSRLSGKVVETMNSGGYTYISIEKNGKKTWVAVPLTEVKIGQELTFRPGTEMGIFASKSLNRTFENIIFSAGIASPGGSAGDKTAMPSHGIKKTAALQSTENISVEKASGPDAYTVGEIFEKRTALNGKNVILNGKVVKVSKAIMGTNWVHVQDGTGDSTNKTNKLVTTSDDLPAVGDVVTVKGIVSTNKDFGAGYKYTVIIEKAHISKK